ncbi:hypothetical protein ACWGS9_24575 [Bradyrhizobium sp. Arg314]
MNTANAQSADIDLASSIAHAGIRPRPKRELTFSLSVGNSSASRPRQCLTAESDLSQFDPYYWHAQSAEEVDPSEGGNAAPEFRHGFDHAETVDLTAWVGAHQAMFRNVRHRLLGFDHAVLRAE